MSSIERRTFLGIAMSAMPLPFLDIEPPLARSARSSGTTEPVYVPAGADRDGVHKTLGISTIDFKVTAADTGGAMLAIENTNRGKGGPAKHRHFAQDELFHVIEGEYVIVIGDQRFELKPGDTVLAPRLVPHVWAYVGNTIGRMLITFTPPGSMEDFFRLVSKGNAMPAQDPALWRAHGMELLGPPLPV
jgi:mannose-6-phosphate isomerase-like protein (cupin superfamily)